MADAIELSDGFVRAVLDDNARLRAEAENNRVLIAGLREQITEIKDRHLTEIYRLVAAAGGNIDTHCDDAVFDDRRLFIERYNYDRTAIYRLAFINEQADPTTKVVAAPNGEAAHG